METNNPGAGEIILDASSGISLEEQQEILAGINAMAAGSRIVPEAAVSEAKKKSFLFPLLVNIGALVILGAGFALLFFLNGSEEQNIRESSAALGHTERRLIQEIRRETNILLGEKEEEINSVLEKLSAADAEYNMLQASVESMTAAQRERAAHLLNVLEENRRSLSELQAERAGIIDDALNQEAAFRARDDQAGHGEENPGPAMEEFRHLGDERERAGRAENQMRGFYAMVNNQINNNQLDEASATLEEMKIFLNAPSLGGNRIMQASRQSHLEAIAAVENAIAATGGSSLALVRAHDQDVNIATLQARNTALEQRAASLEENLRVMSATGSDRDRRIALTISENNTLKNETSTLQVTLNQRTNEIAGLASTISARDVALGEQRNQIAGLNAQIDDLQQRIDDIPGIIEQAFESPAIQDLLGPVSSRILLSAITTAIENEN